MERLTAYFTGTVQGVGFRYTTLRLANRRERITGTVRNLPDGRVLLIAEGPKPDIQALLQDVSRAMSGYIRQIDSRLGPATGEFHRFSVSY